MTIAIWTVLALTMLAVIAGLIWRWASGMAELIPDHDDP